MFNSELLGYIDSLKFSSSHDNYRCHWNFINFSSFIFYMDYFKNVFKNDNGMYFCEYFLCVLDVCFTHIPNIPSCFIFGSAN